MSVDLQPQHIDINYISKPRIEYTQEESFKKGKIYPFTVYQDAVDFSKKIDGIVIHEQGKEFWYVFPKDIEGKFEVVSSMSE